MAGSGAVVTYGELDRRPTVSPGAPAAGVRPGDHVAICMENHPRYLEVWGCHYAGAVYTAASSRLTSGELAYIVDDCGARVVITSHHLADQAAAIVPSTPQGHRAPDARRHHRRL